MAEASREERLKREAGAACTYNVEASDMRFKRSKMENTEGKTYSRRQQSKGFMVHHLLCVKTYAEDKFQRAKSAR